MGHGSDLRVDWATHEAAEYACRRWHYSRSVPAGATVKIGVWEGGIYRGVVIFSRGATVNIGKPYGLRQDAICELTRVALRDHVTPVSRIIAIGIRMLRKAAPGLRLIVSYADTGQGHHGGIYQAGGWVYAGQASSHAYIVNGKQHHPKTLHSRYGEGGQSVAWLRVNVDPNAARVALPGKHRYLMPLDDAMAAQVKPLSKPYPKRSA